jgi:hypothetical protein
MLPGTQSDEDRVKQLLFEYDQLRKEILVNHTLELQILGGTVTFVAVIMTLGFSVAVKNYLAKAALFFVGETIAFIGLMQTLGLAHSTFQIASYLRIFTEAELSSPKWETRLHEFRRNLGRLPYEELTGSLRYTYVFIIVMSYFLASSHALWHILPNFRATNFSNLGVLIAVLFGLALILILTILLLRIAWRQYRLYVVNHDETYTSRWEMIRTMELKRLDQVPPIEASPNSSEKTAIAKPNNPFNPTAR